MSFADLTSGGGGGGGMGGAPRGGPAGNDPGSFERESHSVASAVFQLTTHVSAFKRAVDALGTPKDTRESRARLHKQRETLGSLAKDTSATLRRLAESLPPGDSRAKAAHGKLLKDFQAVLREFQKAQRACAEREAAHVPQADAKGGEVAMLDGYGARGAGERDEDHEQALLLERRDAEDREQLEGEINFNTVIIEEREQGIAEIQAQIGEVNEIFQDLAVMVNEQGTMVDDIESNIVRVSDRTRSAQRELTYADKSQKRARSHMWCLMIMVVIVLIVIIIVLTA